MKKENRGGRREGAGRKPETLSERQVRIMLKTAKRWAKEQKKTLDDILMYIVYNKETADASRLAAIKLFKDYTITKVTAQDVTITTHKMPQVFIPEKYEDSDEAPVFEPSEHHDNEPTQH